jgi:hypothetical protein
MIDSAQQPVDLAPLHGRLITLHDRLAARYDCRVTSLCLVAAL